jgi:hypothetical protein
VTLYYVAKFDAWLEKKGFTKREWAEVTEHACTLVIAVEPERMLEEMRLLARMIEDELLIKLASSQRDAESDELLPTVYCCFQAGDDGAIIFVHNISDRTMRDAIMRLAS